MNAVGMTDDASRSVWKEGGSWTPQLIPEQSGLHNFHIQRKPQPSQKIKVAKCIRWNNTQELLRITQ